MAVDRFCVFPVRAGAALVLLGACSTGTIESAVPGGWDEGVALDPSAPRFSPNGTPLPPSSNPGVPGSTANPAKPGSPGSPGAPGAPGAPIPGLPLDCSNPTVGESPLRRLTRTEYDNSVRDLLGAQNALGKEFVADTQVGLFDNTASTQTIPALLAEQILDAAVTHAESVTDIQGLTGCNPGASGTTGTTCVKNFISSFGRRAFRRPLAADEVTKLQAVFTNTRSASDANTGIKAVVAATLSSPNFLFRPEFGTGAVTAVGSKAASQWELAGRLASLIWASVPDEELLDAAAANQLMTKAQVEAQARRMLEDPRAKPAIADFLTQWFGLQRISTTGKDSGTYPEYDEVLRDSMYEESQRFIEDVVWNGDARLSTLLSANYSFVNAPLAELYGVDAPAATDDTFARVELDPAQRAGVMTQGSVLAAYARPDESSPVKRGQWVRVRILCQDLPNPPAMVPELPAPKEGISNRERFELHTSDPSCAGCHQLIDGLGFGLEQYDGVGRFRTLDQGVAVDSSGEITATSDINQKYEGGTQLANILAGSDTVQDCAPTQLLRFSLGRTNQDVDACSLQTVQDAFEQSGGDLIELVVAITQTPAFWSYVTPQ